MKYGYIFEVAARAVRNLSAGIETLNDCELNDIQADELFKLVSEIEESALEFDKLARLARLVVAKNATTTLEETSNG